MISSPLPDGGSQKKPSVVSRLKKREDFLRAGRAQKYHSALFSLHMVRSPSCSSAEEPVSSRVGLTITKKIGSAVIRNRVRRRLKEAIRFGSVPFQRGFDYVIVVRQDAVSARFLVLCSSLRESINKLHNLHFRLSKRSRTCTND